MSGPPACRPAPLGATARPRRRPPTGCASGTAPTGSPTTGSTTRSPSSPTSATRAWRSPWTTDHLDPFAPDLARRVAARRRPAARRSASAVVIETGARYLLDPWHKHAPTLLHDDPARGSTSCAGPCAIGADLGAEAVSFWAGVRPDDGRPSAPPGTGWSPAAPQVVDGRRRGRRAARLRTGAGHAGRATSPTGAGCAPRSARRPASASPSTSDTAAAWSRCRCRECVAEVAAHLVNVQIDDMRRGVHEHLEFGTGEIDFPPVLRRAADAGYRGLVAVELPRHSHAAPDRRRAESLDVPARGRATARRRLTACDTSDRLRDGSCRAAERPQGRQRDDTRTTCGRRSRAAYPIREWLDDGAARGSRPSRTRSAGSSPRSGGAAAARRCRTRPAGRADDAGAGAAADRAAGDHADRGRRLYRYGDAAEKRAVLRGAAAAADRRRRRCRCCTTRCAPTTPGWSPPRSARTPGTSTSRPGGRRCSSASSWASR